MIQDLQCLKSVSFNVLKGTPECKLFCINKRLWKTLRSKSFTKPGYSNFFKTPCQMFWVRHNQNPSSEFAAQKQREERCGFSATVRLQSFLNLLFISYITCINDLLLMPVNLLFNRDGLLQKLAQPQVWDVLVIGGGATGLGIAVDAATRGYKTVLLEKSDFAQGTSSRSTKLVHGGVRYLAQGNLPLVYSALQERGRLLKNAPHLVRRQPFLIPCYSWMEKIKYLVGLKIYDWLAGRWSFGRSKVLSKKEVTERLPGIKEQQLKGGVLYFDGQFDDARLAVNLAQTAIENGAVVLNHVEVTGLLKEKEKVSGVLGTGCRNRETIPAAG
jgi:hypothetical protein